MRKLTKIINKRRKNYKPTIGLETKDGKRISVNAVEFYIYKAHKEKERQYKEQLKAEAEARELMWEFINQNPTLRQHMNRLMGFMAAIGGMLGGAMYY